MGGMSANKIPSAGWQKRRAEEGTVKLGREWDSRPP